MSGSVRRGGPPVEGSNVPGNPLRSFRMSMLAHGFIDGDTGDEFTLDDADPMAYSVVRFRKKPITFASVAALVIVLLVIAAMVLLT